jgi:hypothetical protein
MHNLSNTKEDLHGCQADDDSRESGNAQYTCTPGPSERITSDFQTLQVFNIGLSRTAVCFPCRQSSCENGYELISERLVQRVSEYGGELLEVMVSGSGRWEGLSVSASPERASEEIANESCSALTIFASLRSTSHHIS